MDGWNTAFLLGRPIFRGYVSFREGNQKFQIAVLGSLDLVLGSLDLHKMAPNVAFVQASCLYPSTSSPQRKAALPNIPNWMYMKDSKFWLTYNMQYTVLKYISAKAMQKP